MKKTGENEVKFERTFLERYSAILGCAVSIVYLAVVVCVYQNLSENGTPLKLNEMGDFLAGFLGPLAIFWLIMGYYQQRVELRQNTSALFLQYEELREATRHQEALAKSTTEALEDARKDRILALLPKFKIDKVGYDIAPRENVSTYRVTNLGESIKMMSITPSGNIDIIKNGLLDAETNWWEKDHIREVSLSLTDEYNGLLGLDYQLKNRAIGQTVFDVLSKDPGKSREIRVVELRL